MSILYTGIVICAFAAGFIIGKNFMEKIALDTQESIYNRMSKSGQSEYSKAMEKNLSEKS